ncbi:MAG: hypothetical protein H7Y36_10875 [Armatimonadetes bacterium]|nr:hypothetical protein [Akkermansiaceae bacterium]
MFLPVFHDLLKPQWLGTLTELKISDGLAVSELSRRLNSSYMTVKQHCEDLTKLGYLQRTRIPRTEIGRPEIFYRLSEKADALFPSIPAEFTLKMLDQIRQLFGENAPEKMLFQYFREQEEVWKARLSKGTTLLYKARLFAKIREQEALFIRCLHEPGEATIILRQFHHPLREIFESYPRAIAMEQRAMEAALGTRVFRETSVDTGNSAGHVDFHISL